MINISQNVTVFKSRMIHNVNIMSNGVDSKELLLQTSKEHFSQ